MTYIFSLSQEHAELPQAEVEAVLTAEDIDFEIQGEKGSLLFVDADDISGLDRLAMTFDVGKLLHEFPPDGYQKLAAKSDPVATNQSFAVRKEQVDDTEAPDELEQNVGRIIDKASDGHVDLDSPDIEYRIFLYDGTAYLAEIVEHVDRSQYEQRQNQYRPYSSPVSIHPRMARTMVNLTEVPRDGTVLDPFCGTGGILIEAGLIGCELYGLDLQEKMVNGTEENLAAFDLDGDIRQDKFANIEALVEEPFDAIVTDLPYGKASKVEGDPTNEFVDLAPTLTDGKVVFMTDKEEVNGLEPAFELFVHRSLTRYLYIID